MQRPVQPCELLFDDTVFGAHPNDEGEAVLATVHLM